MQPSEQNQAPSNAPVSNIPEYLHMEPIPEPVPPKSKKKLVALVALVVAVTIAIASGVFAYIYMSGESDRQLSRALEGSLSAPYFTQIITMTVDSKNQQVAETKYDLSDPSQPKSHSTFMIDTERLSVAGEVVTVNASVYYVRFTELPKNTAMTKGVVADKWYKVTRANLKSAPELIRAFNFDQAAPPLFGSVIVGNFDVDSAGALMEYINSSAIYTYGGTSGGDQSIVYDVTLDSKHIAELNKKMAEQTGKTLPTQYSAMAKNKSFKLNYDLTVNKQTGKVVQLTQIPSADEKDKSVVTTTTYTYPDSITVEVPKDFEEVAGE
jgi:hypothetical protein